MVFVKTQAGQEALKDRHGGLSSRQRSAFILFDGKRTLSEVLAATAAMGITQDDVQTMIAQGLLAPAGGASLPPAADQGGGGVTPPAAQSGSSYQKEAPRLCRGGSRSLTFQEVVHRRDFQS